jgi:hypothetical protein
MTQRSDVQELVAPLRRLHHRIRERVVAAFEFEDPDASDLASVAGESAGDTIYAVDRIGEEALLDFLEQAGLDVPIVLIAEGLENDGRLVVPENASEEEAPWCVIVDPIDGTRGAMYQKRSAWILTGVAPNRGPQTSLADIELALQTEIPLLKQHLSDSVWALAGGPVMAERFNRLTGESYPITLKPSRAPGIAHGFAMISRFFPGARDELASIDEEIVEGALGPIREGKARCFEDQYICSGGQLYELMSGRDRFVADLRPLMEPVLRRKGLPKSLCCHPYDLCTELIARELGVVVTDASGKRLTAPLDVVADVAWVGYANDDIRKQIEPLLQEALRRRGLLDL